MGNKQKHLEFIQSAISRQAGNLFYLKGLPAAFLLVQLAFLPSLCLLLVFYLSFWFLDAYFLSQERRYRDLYDKVAKLKEDQINFSMDVSEFREFKKNSLLCCMMSKPLLFFYAPCVLCSLYFSLNP